MCPAHRVHQDLDTDTAEIGEIGDIGEIWEIGYRHGGGSYLHRLRHLLHLRAIQGIRAIRGIRGIREGADRFVGGASAAPLTADSSCGSRSVGYTPLRHLPPWFFTASCTFDG